MASLIRSSILDHDIVIGTVNQHPNGGERLVAKSTKKLPFVSVITLNWNGERFLRKLLPILESQTYPRDRYEVIVVDNYSTKDDSRNFVRKNFPNARLIENDHNAGFTGGMNLGMKETRGDYIVLINNDTQPKNNWLAELVTCAQRHKAGGVVPKLLFANRGGGKIINNAGSVLHPDRPWPVEEIGAGQKDGPKFSKEIEISALCGTSPLYSRKMLEDIGLFDKHFFMYFEDSDLSWRAQKAGWKFYYCPTSVVSHEHTASSGEFTPFWTFHVTRNRLLLLFKQSRLSIALRATAGVLREFILAPVYNGLRGRERNHQWYMFKMGAKIILSFLLLLPSMLLKRWRLLPEVKL